MSEKGMIPRIINSFAAREIQSGGTWKVYLKAEDPDGDMKYILCMLEQAAAGVYPVSLIRIPADQRKRLCGYIYLNTGGVGGEDSVSLMLTVNIQDKAGRYSDPVSFPLRIQSGAKDQNPATGLFEERELGPIMIDLIPIGP